MTESVVNANALRANVRLLGDLLGSIISKSEGQALFDQVEQIRLCSKDAQQSETLGMLYELLRQLDDAAILKIARAFSQFLNLANIADQYHTTSSAADASLSARATLNRTLSTLKSNHSAHTVEAALDSLHMDLVLTAHPTEITRRTLIHKHREITRCLSTLDRAKQNEANLAATHDRLAELVAQIWHTYDFRVNRPTPIDEARWGFAVIENSLWDAVPQFMQSIDVLRAEHDLQENSFDWTPIQISSWIGGDRDGNPNVTAVVTQEVLLLAQWQACELTLRDVNRLYEELSMTTASAALQQATNTSREPYRAQLRPLREMLKKQLADLDLAINAGISPPKPLVKKVLLAPIVSCYESLLACGMSSIAKGLLRDTLRRIQTFGPHLIKLDIRQESGRHTQALTELTEFLGLGQYATWCESQRLEFLQGELRNRRPLIPADWQPTPETQEVIDTFLTIADTPEEALGCYVISMAESASDVLAVQLLFKATGCRLEMPVAPLFETLNDLNNAAAVIAVLTEDEDYCSRCDRQLMVMIGYSDSAKDAGMFAAGWAQYRAQEALLALCAQQGFALTLFHGRGGSIGRGGAPAHQALLSQPPNSLQNGLRVTEQGEMIRTKLGDTALAVNTFGQYASAILSANIMPPPQPTPQWRALMDQLADNACAVYRGWVRHEVDFVDYFRQATPEQELTRLPLGSRPARRSSQGGISSLRAIPWVFAWSQNRLMLPAWLGAGEALEAALSQGKRVQITHMLKEWPFFTSRLSMLEMVLAKADLSVAALYDQMLVEDRLKPIGKALREQLHKDTDTLLKVLEQSELLEFDPQGMASIQLRNVYTYPLNLLQAELLKRVRRQPDAAEEQALMVTIAGVAAGMRNTG